MLPTRRRVGRLVTTLVIAAAPLVAITATTSVARADTDDCGVTGNLVADCGFESASTFSYNTSPPGWTYTPASAGANFYTYNDSPRTGQVAAWFGSVAEQDDSISQDIAGTTPGASYTASIWTQNAYQCPDVPTHLAATVTGTASGTATLVDQNDNRLSSWTQYSTTFTAGSSAPTLSISGYDACGFEVVDDVSVVQNGPSLPASVPGGTYGTAYSQSLAATGGTAPYGYAVTAGALPAGLSLDGATGLLDGTPTAAGDASFSVTATDSSDPAQTATVAYTLTVAKAAPTTTFDSPTTGGVVGQGADIDITTSSSAAGASYSSLTPQTCDVSGPSVEYLHPGTCTVEVDLVANADNLAAVATTSVPVSQAATTTAVHVTPDALTADVAVLAPGAGVATGTVTFQVGADVVGTAGLVNGVATLDVTVPPGAAREVAATYAGDTDFTGSSDSTTRNDPSITARVTSYRGASHWGWYRTPVTVHFSCATDGAPLLAPCPAAVVLGDDVAGASVTRTITAVDGGADTVVVRGIDIDRTDPSVHVGGIRDGATYGGSVPTARCIASDRLSGVATCRITRDTRGGLVHYTATATDKAGDTASVHGSYRVLGTYLVGVPFRHGAFQVHRTAYSLVTHAASRPHYVNAAPAGVRPSGGGVPFTRTGGHTWAITVSLAGLPRDSRWNLGVRVGGELRIVTVQVH